MRAGLDPKAPVNPQILYRVSLKTLLWLHLIISALGNSIFQNEERNPGRSPLSLILLFSALSDFSFTSLFNQGFLCPRPGKKAAVKYVHRKQWLEYSWLTMLYELKIDFLQNPQQWYFASKKKVSIGRSMVGQKKWLLGTALQVLKGCILRWEWFPLQPLNGGGWNPAYSTKELYVPRAPE